MRCLVDLGLGFLFLTCEERVSSFYSTSSAGMKRAPTRAQDDPRAPGADILMGRQAPNNEQFGKLTSDHDKGLGEVVEGDWEGFLESISGGRSSRCRGPA